MRASSATESWAGLASATAAFGTIEKSSVKSVIGDSGSWEAMEGEERSSSSCKGGESGREKRTANRRERDPGEGGERGL